MVSWHKILAQNATGWQITGVFFLKGSEKRCKLWQFPHGFFSSKFHVTTRHPFWIFRFFFLLHARGGGFPVQLAWLKCIYPSGTVELYIWELWFLVVEGIIECPELLDRNRITHPAQKTSFVLFIVLLVVSQPCFVFGGVAHGCLPHCLVSPWCFLSTMCQRYDQTAKHCRGQGY